MPRLVLAVLVLSLIMITVSVMVAVQALTPETTEEGHRVHPKPRVPGMPR